MKPKGPRTVKPVKKAKRARTTASAKAAVRRRKAVASSKPRLKAKTEAKTLARKAPALRKKAKPAAKPRPPLPKPSAKSLSFKPALALVPTPLMVPVVAPVAKIKSAKQVESPVAKPPAPKPPEAESAGAPFPFRIPPILLEGDEPSTTPSVGLGEKFALGPVEGSSPTAPLGELPVAYGTGRLVLVARDPHCLYANWDLTIEQQRLCNGLSTHRHLVVRVYPDRIGGPPIQEIHVHPESRHWFIHVDRAGAIYVAELGYYSTEGQWRTVATSDATATPPETTAEDKTVRFATFNLEVPKWTPPQGDFAPKASDEPRNSPASVNWQYRPPQTFMALGPQEAPVPGPAHHEPVRAEVGPPDAGHIGVPGEVSAEPRLEWAASPPEVIQASGPAWTPEQERALAEVIGWAVVRQQWLGSAEISEALEGRGPSPISSLAVAGLPALGAPFAEVSSPGPGFQVEFTSPGGAALAPEQNFWFKVNADLVIYGATEPDAQVTIGGRPIRLRPDGTFSYRFALPDGFYPLPISATAAHGDTRTAELEFYRGTRYRGEVGAHPREPALKAPHAENVS